MVNICEYGIIWGTWQKLVRMVWDSVQSMTRCFLCFKICFYVDLWFAFKYRAGCQLCYAVLAVWIFVVCLASRRTELLPSLPAGQAARAICLRPTCHSPIQCSFGLHQLAFGWHEAFFLVFLSLQSSIQVCGWVSHVFYWQGALQLFGGFQWSGVQPEVEQAAFWSNGACLQLPGCCGEWVDKSGDIAWECIDMWKIRFQNCTPCENTPNPKAYWCLQYSQLPYETTGRLGGQIQARPNSKRKSEVYHV